MVETDCPKNKYSKLSLPTGKVRINDGNYLMLAQSCVFCRVFLDNVTPFDALADPRPSRTSFPHDIPLANKEKFREAMNFAKNLQVPNQEEFGGGQVWPG